MKEKSSQVAITGANGFVGRNLTKFLNRNKVSVISLTRSKHLPLKYETNVRYSDLDQKSLISKLKNCNALVHLIGQGAQSVDATYSDINVGLTKKIVKLCKNAKIRKIVYISGFGVSKSTTFGYFISKFKAEQEIIRSGLDYTILRASYIVGNNDPLTKNLNKQIKNGSVIIPGSGSYRLQPISVDNVAKVILASTTSKQFSNKIVDLVGPQTVTFENFVRRFTKKQTKIKKIDLEEAYHTALNQPKNAIYGLDDLNILVGDFVGSHKKLERLCGFKLTPLKEIL
ncbi:NAD(P)H-binding protein [Candidatus Nitrosotenuis chungbukensis]|uniref:SDR family oxidoreductase n=1 Tax=Candidatus Nitrosotenuis chungbukensis TaxID=1353246 RepID=UPI0005B2B7DC|nr:NAD(P)H-binding protein [Candidatus Nitrosotenuis chungbukensis]WKT58372.1 NAD(P)H-binding protein [Candidatus Nitrosotenuis chungbukensis]